MVPLKYNLRSIRSRWVSSLMTVIGTGLVVWASVLAFGLASGLDHTLAVSGEPLDLIALRKGATAETSSIITEELAAQIAAQKDIATDEQGRRLVSEELVTVVNTARRGDGTHTNLVIRGVTPMALALRPNWKIVEGRHIRPGVREAVTSRSVANRFEGAALGEELDVLGSKFRIVGLFDAGDSAVESEVWTDLKVLSQTSRRAGVVSSVQLRATGESALERIKNRLVNDEQFALKAVSEQDYFAEQASAGAVIKFVGYVISFFLTFGAMFAVANTMFGAVASRAREIGTLRALGFGRLQVLSSFIMESLVLCLLGGLVGCLGTLPLNGMSTGTVNWDTFSELTFAFRFDAKVLLKVILIVAAMGVFGGLLPAIRAVRMNIVDSLREI